MNRKLKLFEQLKKQKKFEERNIEDEPVEDDDIPEADLEDESEEEANENNHADDKNEKETIDDGKTKKYKKIYVKHRTRVLVLSNRGITHRYRHLMADLKSVLPHSKKESKLDNKDQLYIVNEICELRNCNYCMFFEVRKKMDLYLWISHTPLGPSVKFNVQNVHTMDELKLTGNCLMGSRAILSFDKNFDNEPHFQIIKELLSQVFSTPPGQPKSKPFIDHVFSFHIVDNRIWFRHYQIAEKEGKKDEHILVEIGPRLVLDTIRIFAGSFGGATLYENPFYISPNEVRHNIKNKNSGRYNHRVHSKNLTEQRKSDIQIPMEVTDDLFE